MVWPPHEVERVEAEIAAEEAAERGREAAGGAAAAAAAAAPAVDVDSKGGGPGDWEATRTGGVGGIPPEETA